MNEELARLDATGQAALVRRGEVKATELVDAAIGRIEALDGVLGAVIHRSFERARARAASPDLEEGPFRGVPFLMKDIGGAQAGEPQHAGMRALKEADWREDSDSYFTQKLLAAGFVPLGRTNTPEFALLPTTEPEAYGPTRNPWSLDHSSGGSSGGSSSAVAAGLVPAAHASDGGGSIRGPASMCGLVGLKPTRGRCSFGPSLGERWSGLSSELALTRSVRDTASILDVLAGRVAGDPYAAAPPARPFAEALGIEPGGLRIGVFDDAPRDIQLHPESLAAVSGAARALEALGHEVEIAHPEALEDPACVATYVAIVSANVAYAIDSWSGKLGRTIGQDDVEALSWALAERGRGISAAQHIANIEFVHRFGRRLADWWEGGFDLLLTATQAAPPPEIGTLTSTPDEPFRAFVRAGPYGVFTLPYNLSGQPAISLPLHWTAGDPALPVGVQLVAATGREDLLLQVARQLEQAQPWIEKRPPVFG